MVCRKLKQGVGDVGGAWGGATTPPQVGREGGKVLKKYLINPKEYRKRKTKG